MGSVLKSCSASLEPCLIDEDFVTETLLKGASIALSPKASLSSPPRRTFPRLDFTLQHQCWCLLLPCMPWDLQPYLNLSLQKGLQVPLHICSLAELCSLPWKNWNGLKHLCLYNWTELSNQPCPDLSPNSCVLYATFIYLSCPLLLVWLRKYSLLSFSLQLMFPRLLAVLLFLFVLSSLSFFPFQYGAPDWLWGTTLSLFALERNDYQLFLSFFWPFPYIFISE